VEGQQESPSLWRILQREAIMLTANALSASARSELLGVNVLLSCTPTVRHRVWVFNPTPRSLELGLQAGCGCAVAEEIPQVLKPFWGFPITIVIDAAGKPAGRKSERVELIVRSGSRGVSWRESLEVRYSVAEPASPSTHHR
jgi:hypothetical protein